MTTRIRAARAPLAPVTVQRFARGAITTTQALVAAEAAVALVIRGRNQAVLLATPADLADLALGHALAEGIIATKDAIQAIQVVEMGQGIEIELELAEHAAVNLDETRRQSVASSSCGLCGIASIEAALRPIPPVTSRLQATPAAILDGFAALARHQPLRAQTGCPHAAAIARPDGAILLAREDIGRHNALDKLIGAAAEAGLAGGDHVLLLTSRLSAEMVQKAARYGFAVLAAISAPTALAIELAESLGITLAAFARGEALAVYTHPERLLLP